MNKIPKTKDEWKNAVMHQLWVKVVLLILTASVTFILASGKSAIKEKILEVVKPSMDTLSQKVDATDAKVKAIDDKMNALIKVMSQAFPEFKKAALEQAKENFESKEVRDALTGESE